MHLTHTLVALLACVSCALVDASCVQTPEGTPGADGDTAATTAGVEGLDVSSSFLSAATPCEDACFVLYLAACAVCRKQGLGSACYAAALEEYVRCMRRCRDSGD